MVSAAIAWYLFLAGAGSGAFLIASTVDLVLRLRPGAARGRLARVSVATDAGLVAGPALVAVGAMFLVADLGVPERALTVFLAPSPSLLSLGAWAIALFVVAAMAALVFGALAGAAEGDLDRQATAGALALRVLELAASLAATAAALFVLGYAGVFLSAYPALPFLHTPWVPALFTASGLATGLASLMVIALFRQTVDGMAEAARSLLLLDAALVLVEGVLLAVLMATAFAADGPALEAAWRLVAGSLAWGFWLVVVLAGLVVPLSVDVVCRRAPSMIVIASGAACSLVGGLALRFVLLMATERFNLASMSAVVFWA